MKFLPNKLYIWFIDFFFFNAQIETNIHTYVYICNQLLVWGRDFNLQWKKKKEIFKGNIQDYQKIFQIFISSSLNFISK